MQILKSIIPAAILLLALPACNPEKPAASAIEGTYRLKLKTKDRTLPYTVQLVTAPDSAIYGSIRALPDSIDFEFPLRLQRSTTDSLYFGIYGRTRLVLGKGPNRMTGYGLLTEDKQLYPAAMTHQADTVDRGLRTSRELTPVDFGFDDARWPTPASGGNIYFTNNRKIYFAERQGEGFRIRPLSYDTVGYNFFSIGLSPDEQTLIAHGNVTNDSLPKVGGGDYYFLHLNGRTDVDAIELLPRSVNTPTYDIFPAFMPDGSLLVTSYGEYEGVEAEGRADLYHARKENGAYRVSSLSSNINSPEAEAGAYMDPQKRFVLFHRNSRTPPRFSDKLFISRKTEAGWSAPEPLSFAVNEAYGGWSPRISRDGEYLYFNSAFRSTWEVYRLPVSEAPELAGFYPPTFKK